MSKKLIPEQLEPCSMEELIKDSIAILYTLCTKSAVLGRSSSEAALKPAKREGTAARNR